MGACASTPKTLDDNVEKVAAPEQPKEETTVTEEVVVADKAVEDVKVEKEETKEVVKSADVANGDEVEKSVDSLPENTEEVKKGTVEEPNEAVASAPVAAEEAAAVEAKKE